jgi:hypothetical protein
MPLSKACEAQKAVQDIDVMFHKLSAIICVQEMLGQPAFA